MTRYTAQQLLDRRAAAVTFLGVDDAGLRRLAASREPMPYAVWQRLREVDTIDTLLAGLPVAADKG